MRDINRIEPLLNKLADIWKKCPDLRLGQLIGNVISNPTALYYIEDDQLIEELSKFYEQ